MKSIKAQVNSLTYFVGPMYETLLDETGDSSEAKKQTIEILVEQISRVANAYTQDGGVDLYVITPMLKMIEMILVSKIKNMPINKDTPEEVKKLINFYKDVLVSIYKFDGLCSKTKKE